MVQALIHFDDATLSAIDRIALAARQNRSDFVRIAVKDAIFLHETERMKEAYLQNPDSEEDFNTCYLPEEWK